MGLALGQDKAEPLPETFKRGNILSPNHSTFRDQREFLYAHTEFRKAKSLYMQWTYGFCL
jgi:hypothetical protein